MRQLITMIILLIFAYNGYCQDVGLPPVKPFDDNPDYVDKTKKRAPQYCGVETQMKLTDIIYETEYGYAILVRCRLNLTIKNLTGEKPSRSVFIDKLVLINGKMAANAKIGVFDGEYFKVIGWVINTYNDNGKIMEIIYPKFIERLTYNNK